MSPELQELLLAAAEATHQYWTAVRAAMDGLPNKAVDSNLLDQYADQSRNLSRMALELHEKEG